MGESRRKSGFSIIEILVVLSILSVLAAIGLPALVTYTKRSKTAEAFGNLKSLFLHSNTYFEFERTDARDGTGTIGRCLVDPTMGTIPATPSPEATRPDFSADASLHAIGFSVSDPVRYGYGIDSPGTACGLIAASVDVYTLYAEGDLDGDTTLSRFELAVGINSRTEMYHAPGFYVVNEIE